MSYYGNPNNASGGSHNDFYSQPVFAGNTSSTSSSSSTQPQPTYNAQSWQAPTQQQPSQQQQQTSSQQQPSSQAYGAPAPSLFGAPSNNTNNNNAGNAAIFNPAAMSGLVGNQAVQQIMMDQGQQFVLQGIAKIIPGLESTMIVLRAYFAVDNQYVLKKIQKVLLPFFSKNWSRQIKQHAGPETPAVYELPLLDENAPDLYLPTMTLLTYVLLCAFLYGTAGQFDPDVIPNVTTKCVVTQLLQVVAVKIGFYSMSAGKGPTVSFLDLCSWTGYKYLGLCVNLFLATIASRLMSNVATKVYYFCFCWTAAAAAYFLWQTIESNSTTTAMASSQRNIVAAALAVSQIATMWFVGQTQYLE